MPDILLGGCLCGHVRYSVTGETAGHTICHCTSCQKQSGSAFLEMIAVPDKAFSFNGTLKTYTNEADSGHKQHRQFCARCGTTVMKKMDIAEGMTFVMAGTLDDNDRNSFKPSEALYCQSVQPWLLDPDHRMLNYDQMPPNDG